MSVRPDIRPWLKGVTESLNGIGELRMQIQVLTPAGARRRLGAKLGQLILR